MKLKEVLKKLKKENLLMYVNCEKNGFVVWGEEIDNDNVVAITLHLKENKEKE